MMITESIIEDIAEKIKKFMMKAKIILIGRVENGNPVDWSFDSFTTIPALTASGAGILYYGYTVEELEQIWKMSSN
jgi:hypothetical protein